MAETEEADLAEKSTLLVEQNGRLEERRNNNDTAAVTTMMASTPMFADGDSRTSKSDIVISVRNAHKRYGKVRTSTTWLRKLGLYFRPNVLSCNGLN